MTQLEAARAFCDLFEAELLTQLMLDRWLHPFASDHEHLKDLVERAAEILAAAQNGDQLFEDIRPEHLNFVAALWYAECSQISDAKDADTEARRQWLSDVRRALPSCFCDPSDLPES